MSSATNIAGRAGSAALNIGQSAYQKVSLFEAGIQGKYESSAIGSAISGSLGNFFDQNGPPEAIANPIDAGFAAWGIMSQASKAFGQVSTPMTIQSTDSNSFETLKSFQSQTDFGKFFGKGR